MPLYDYRCPCGAAFERLARHDETVTCECGQPAVRQVCAPRINASFLGSTRNPGYQCPVTDQWVDSTRKRKEIMREHNLMEKK